MPHLFWYYGLIVIGTAITVYTALRKGDADLFPYFVFATACSWIGEAVVLFVFNAYAYKPGLFADPFADNIIGHIIANTALWSSVAIAVMYFQLSYFRIGLFSVAFMLIEVVFVRAGVYSHYWWHTFMTGLATFLFMVLMKKWYSIVYAGTHKAPRLITLWTIAWTFLQTPTSVLMLFEKQFFRVRWVDNLYRDSTLFSGFVYHAGIAVLFIACLCMTGKNYWKAVPLLAVLAGDVILWKMNVLEFHGGWSIGHLACFRAASFLSFIAVERFTLRPRSDRLRPIG
ncbi:hypothetical protein [Paenibacillus flagellatus]|uniref:Uncharacterized protein n=1 Tax=Paenibacillus flagellatus TaxID=2211139 RepID=A0A2V5KDV7_9BACL|nr:hypothetical protein [Paenibacillus flagellatus]PYI52130.1 hypothetical protein DLM86_21870 [Paenibacillus flagellatus]